MTKRAGRYSENAQQVPVAAAARGAPLPLVTQPIHAVDNGHTRIDNSLARIDPALTLQSRNGESAVLFGKPTALMVSQQRPHVSAVPPPEIGLTQHQLPPDERLAA